MTGKVFKAAFVVTLPVLMGYVTMGLAAGILLASEISGICAPFWGLLTSVTSISGALQFIMVDWMKASTPLLDVALLTFCLNVRYAMYGLSLIERFHGIPRHQKLYLIWAMTDETYAIEVENRTPPGENPTAYCLAVAMLDHLYWVIGVTAGALIGVNLPFNTRGIDFAMTALFIVILTDQCREKSNRIPALIGGAAALAGRLFFSVDNMIIPAMLFMTAAFILLRRKLDNAVGVNGEKSGKTAGKNAA